MNKKGTYFIEVIKYFNEDVETFIFNNGTVFHQYSFLCSVGQKYKCLIVKNSRNEILGVLPTVESYKYKVKSLNLPPFTYYYGPVFSSNIIFDRLELITLLMDEVSSYSIIDFKFNLQNEDIYIYKSKGYIIEANPTYLFSSENNYSIDELSRDKRRDLKKLLKLVENKKLYIIEGKGDIIDEVIGLWKKTSERANFNPNQELLNNIVNSGINYYSNIVYDEKGTALAGTICPYDKKSMYHLIGASIKNNNKLLSRANILSLFSAVKKSNSMTLNFDFEGSNILGVARFYRSMGGKPDVMYSIHKTNSFYYKFIEKFI